MVAEETQVAYNGDLQITVLRITGDKRMKADALL